MTKRLVEYDILKAIAIFLVIWQHVINVCGFGQDFIETRIGGWITAVNMPLFMFMVGMFSLSSMTKPLAEVVKSKWNTLLLPMFIFCAIQLIIEISFHNQLNYNVLSTGGGKLIVLTFIKSYWFIWALLYSIFWLRLFYWIFRSRFSMVVLSIISWIILMIIPRNLPIPHFMYFQSMYVFFILGVIFKVQKSIKTTLSSNKLFLGPLLLIVFALLTWHYQKEDSFYYFLLISTSQYITAYIKMVIAGICGIGVLLILVEYAAPYNNNLWKWLTNVGTFTLSIYLMQGVLCEIAGYFSINIHNQLIDAILAITIFIILGQASLWLSKNRITARYLLGKT